LGDIGVRAVCFDPAAELRRRASELPNVVAVTNRFDALFEHRPAALIVASPDRWHLEQVDRATSIGVPVLVEKPIAPSISEAAEAVRTIQARGVPVLVGYVLRHRRVMQVLRSLVGDGAVGEPTAFQVMLGAYGTITAAVSRFAQPEDNRLYRDYSHEWDYLRWLFGPVEAVCALARTTSSVPHVEHPNLVDALLRMTGGTAGAVHLDYVDRRGTRAVHVIGTEGTIFADIAAGVIDVRGVNARHDRRLEYPQTAAEALQRQADHLLSVAESTAEPLVSLADGLAALAVTETAVRSAATGGWESCQDAASGSSTPATASRNVASGAVTGGTG
jgi:predicted dehydrogenase